MSADNINTLVQVAIRVLERYAFLLGDPPAPGTQRAALPGPAWNITIAFNGPRAGVMGMVVPPDLAAQVAANLYSEDASQVSQEQAADAVKELLNIVCGHYLHAIEGDKVLFTLSAPEQRTLTREEAAQYVGGKSQAALVVEGSPLLLFIEN
jgi:CheY-specific phosphatase CheX